MSFIIELYADFQLPRMIKSAPKTQPYLQDLDGVLEDWVIFGIKLDITNKHHI